MKTIVDVERMKKNLIAVRKNGIAFDDEEWGVGIKSVAAGVKGQNGDIIAAIGTEVPSVHLSYSRMNELVSKIKDCADKISQDLGFLPNPNSKS
jgi:DNA-binding IclR family transcriptional regulator